MNQWTDFQTFKKYSTQNLAPNPLKLSKKGSDPAIRLIRVIRILSYTFLLGENLSVSMKIMEKKTQSQQIEAVARSWVREQGCEGPAQPVDLHILC